MCNALGYRSSPMRGKPDMGRKEREYDDNRSTNRNRVLHTAKSPLIPESWRAIYANPLAARACRGFSNGGRRSHHVSFGTYAARKRPRRGGGAASQFRIVVPGGLSGGRRRLMGFWPVREPGLAIMFLAQAARKAGICSILPSSHVLANTTSIITAK